METTSLKSYIYILDVITLIALAVTFLVAIPSFFLKNQLQGRQDSVIRGQALEIALANKLAGEANLRADTIEQENLKLRLELAKLNPRVLLFDANRMSIILSPFKGLRVSIQHSDETESSSLRDSLNVAFSKSGIQCEYQLLNASSVEKGVSIQLCKSLSSPFLKDTAKARKMAIALIKEFKRIKIDVDSHIFEASDNSFYEYNLRIIIGADPKPYKMNK